MNIYKGLGIIIINLSIYHYIKPFNIGTKTDIQMYYFGFSLIYLFIRLNLKKKINVVFIQSILYISIILTLFILIEFEKIGLNLIRGTFGYISFFIMFNIFYDLFNIIELIRIEKILKINFYIWSMIASGQLIDNTFLIFWRHRAGIGGGRGAISFANEPAYFSLTMILLSLILFEINVKNRKYMVYTFFISLFLAKSSVGVLYSLSIVFILYWSDIKKNILKFGIIIYIMFFILSGYYINNSSSRMGYILKSLQNNPLETILKDNSLKTRVVHLIFPIIKIKENFFLPNGVLNFTEDFYDSQDKVKFLYPENSQIVREIGFKNQYENKIVSFHGAIIYELGILGLYIYWFIYKKLKTKKIFIIIMLLGLNGLNITNPLLAFLISISYFKKNKCLNESVN